MESLQGPSTDHAIRFRRECRANTPLSPIQSPGDRACPQLEERSQESPSVATPRVRAALRVPLRRDMRKDWHSAIHVQTVTAQVNRLRGSEWFRLLCRAKPTAAPPDPWLPVAHPALPLSLEDDLVSGCRRRWFQNMRLLAETHSPSCHRSGYVAPGERCAFPSKSGVTANSVPQ